MLMEFIPSLFLRVKCLKHIQFGNFVLATVNIQKWVEMFPAAMMDCTIYLSIYFGEKKVNGPFINYYFSSLL